MLRDPLKLLLLIALCPACDGGAADGTTGGTGGVTTGGVTTGGATTGGGTAAGAGLLERPEGKLTLAGIAAASDEFAVEK